MKKSMAALFGALIAGMALAGCGSSGGTSSGTPDTVLETQAAAQASESQASESQAAESQAAGAESGAAGGEIGSSNILVAYFSVPETDGVDTVAGASRVVVDGQLLGSCQYVAQLISEATGGEMFRIETVREYPGSHDPLLEFAYNERAEDARPELATQIENLDSYDVIFLGYPNWNADLPMPLYTFLESYDLSGKTIIPFTTHGGSGFSRTIQTIRDLQPNATVEENGLSISRNSVPEAESDVTEWISGLGL